MAGSFEISGSNIIVHFEYTAPTVLVQSIVGDAAEALYKGNEFESLTNQEKLDLVDDYVKMAVINIANTHKSIKAQVAAKELEAQNEYSL